MNQLSDKELNLVSGGSLDWGAIAYETGKGAIGAGAAGAGGAGFIGAFGVKTAVRAIPYVGIVFATWGAASAGYDEVIRQLNERQSNEAKVSSN